MIITIDHANQVAEFWASREVQEDCANAARLDAWKRRYPFGVVEVPSIVEKPNWPAFRASIAQTATVTRLKAKGRG